MHLTQLQGTNLRCFPEFSLTPVSGVNLLLGQNGAGKTSILEAIHILGYGRSFRGRIRDGLIRQGQTALQISANWIDPAGQAQQAGFQHTGSDWVARMNGQDVESLGQFCEQFPVISFEPGSHALISGAAEYRRRFTDWALFHVEPEFTRQWRRFHRALKQRNALLKQNPTAAELLPWDQEYAESGESLGHYRQHYLQGLTPGFRELVARFLPECGALRLEYQAGWRDSQIGLFEALRLSQARDMQSGFCTVGPHRADWVVSLGDNLQQAHFSRGQAKLLALAALLAQAQCFVDAKAYWPILCFDDIGSELDQVHSAEVMALLKGCPAQIWLSGTERAIFDRGDFPLLRAFHVERGIVQALC